MGILLDKTITDNEFVTERELIRVRRSADLVTLVTDNAYGFNSSTVLASDTDDGTPYSVAAVVRIVAGAGLERVPQRSIRHVVNSGIVIETGATHIFRDPVFESDVEIEGTGTDAGELFAM
jgi:hypothetical protein